MRRPGFTLIELIVAMAASTVLLSSLAATVVIPTRLLETPPDDRQLWRDRMIADRVASDLRYATNIDDTATYGFQITRPHPTNGTPQTIAYQSYLDGLTRQVDGNAAVSLADDSPTYPFQVDGYTAPTNL